MFTSRCQHDKKLNNTRFNIIQGDRVYVNILNLKMKVQK